MIEFEALPALREPVLVAAFEGWNDAADAATGVLDHLLEAFDGQLFAELDPEDYYDFQVNRPSVTIGERGLRDIVWPGTRMYTVCPPDGPDLVVVRGVEPSMRWRSFVSEIVGLAFELDVDHAVTLGALLADSPHTRPVPVTGIASDSGLARQLTLEPSRYEGPTGVVGVLTEALSHAGISTVSYWAAVPHYVAQAPCPKATLELLRRLEDAVPLTVPHGDLEDDAVAWERSVDELAAADDEVAEYVKSLEEARDTADLPEASGDAIAREFERYLRRRDDPPAPRQPNG